MHPIEQQILDIIDKATRVRNWTNWRYLPRDEYVVLRGLLIFLGAHADRNNDLRDCNHRRLTDIGTDANIHYGNIKEFVSETISPGGQGHDDITEWEQRGRKHD